MSNADMIRQAISQADGDNLERANSVFGKMSDRELDSQWGYSSKTAREIWQEYKDSREKWVRARKWFEALCRKEGV